jgi:RNA-directed DNA polymerase
MGIKPQNPPPLFSMDDLEKVFKWVSGLRKDYSPNSDIWRLRRDWGHIKDELLARLNDGSYTFDLLERYEFDDAIISLWSSKDMIALKLITSSLHQQMADHLPKSCYHIKGHGGLKKAVHHTHDALLNHQFVMRSDIKGYYESIRFDVLMDIIESYIQHPVLLTLIRKALRRTETRGGNFYDYHDKSLPKGSPLSPLLGAIALIPLDKAMGQIRDIFYARFMDDWVVLTKTKTALRKVVKKTHEVINNLQLQLHPAKTYIGKIARGFNFLGYYMDDQKILPSKETIRRFHERSTVLYEPSSGNRNVSRRSRRNPHGRDISEYHANEPAPTEADVQNIFTHLLALAARSPDTLATLRRYVRKWTCWLKLGLSSLKELEQCVSGKRGLSPAPAPIRTQRASFPALRSNLSKATV